MNYYKISDKAIIDIIGERLQTARINQNKTQEDLSLKSGVSLRTIKNIESGSTSSNLKVIIALLRALEMLDQLDNFSPDQKISPIMLAEMQGKKRQRASKKGDNTQKAKDEPIW
jgi:transcriptional regulator with XRE-family HTH domain